MAGKMWNASATCVSMTMSRQAAPNSSKNRPTFTLARLLFVRAAFAGFRRSRINHFCAWGLGAWTFPTTPIMPAEAPGEVQMN
jgi:hypothetical protein